jgi:hypothetical protein
MNRFENQQLATKIRTHEQAQCPDGLINWCGERALDTTPDSKPPSSMDVTVDCWIPEAIDTQLLPPQVGNASCRWKVAAADLTTHPGGIHSGRTEPTPSEYVALFDSVGELAGVWDSLAQGLERLRTNAAIAAVWLVSVNDPWSQLLFRDQPATWASLCLGPANPVQLLFRRSTLDSVGRATEMSSPGWSAAVELGVREAPIAVALPSTIPWRQLPVDRLPPLTPPPASGAPHARRSLLQVHLPTLAHRETSDPCDRDALQSGV